MARAMVTQYGMSAKLGAVKYGSSDAEPFLGRDMGHERDYSEEVAADIDAEVRALIEGAHDEAWEILVEYRDVLDELVLELIDKETLSKEDMERICAPVTKRPAAGTVQRLRQAHAVRPAAGAHPGRDRRASNGELATAHGSQRGHPVRRRRTPPRAAVTRRRRAAVRTAALTGRPGRSDEVDRARRGRRPRTADRGGGGSRPRRAPATPRPG